MKYTKCSTRQVRNVFWFQKKNYTKLSNCNGNQISRHFGRWWKFKFTVWKVEYFFENFNCWLHPFIVDYCQFGCLHIGNDNFVCFACHRQLKNGFVKRLVETRKDISTMSRFHLSGRNKLGISILILI